MLKRTIPSVSFTASHRALMLRTNKPLLGHEMNSTERYKAAWDDIPFSMIGWSNKDTFAWYWRCLYDLGLRDNMRWTKIRHIGLYANLGICLFFLYKCYFVACIYYPVFGEFPEHMKKENSRAHAQSKGFDVWCADGKFLKPYFHISPPMLTMTAEELS
eukprot:Tbor_TRINITY_DN5222_c0_g1::TRINITY_DN5222_c0_g1_i1::g.16359::m.16359